MSIAYGAAYCQQEPDVKFWQSANNFAYVCSSDINNSRYSHFIHRIVPKYTSSPLVYG